MGGDASLCIQVRLGDRLKSLLSYLPPNDYRCVYGDAAFGSQDYVLRLYKRAGNRGVNAFTEGDKSVAINQKDHGRAWIW